MGAVEGLAFVFGESAKALARIGGMLEDDPLA